MEVEGHGFQHLTCVPARRLRRDEEKRSECKLQHYCDEHLRELGLVVPSVDRRKPGKFYQLIVRHKVQFLSSAYSLVMA